MIFSHAIRVICSRINVSHFVVQNEHVQRWFGTRALLLAYGKRCGGLGMHNIACRLIVNCGLDAGNKMHTTQCVFVNSPLACICDGTVVGGWFER